MLLMKKLARIAPGLLVGPKVVFSPEMAFKAKIKQNDILHAPALSAEKK
jgi:hypothetical protein